MSQARIGGEGITRRKHRISQLTEKKVRAQVVEGLRGNPGWEAMKGTLEEIIGNLGKKIDICLAAAHDEQPYSEARCNAAQKGILEFVLAMVEKPADVTASLDSEITAIKEELKAAEAGELL